jgi:hypothetical protein
MELRSLYSQSPRGRFCPVVYFGLPSSRVEAKTRGYGAPRDVPAAGTAMPPANRLYEPPIFEGRVMLPEEQEQIYEEIILLSAWSTSVRRCAS